MPSIHQRSEQRDRTWAAGANPGSIQEIPIPTELNDPSLELANAPIEVVPVPGDVQITSSRIGSGVIVIGPMSVKTGGRVLHAGRCAGVVITSSFESESRHTASSAVVLLLKSEGCRAEERGPA